MNPSVLQTSSKIFKIIFIILLAYFAARLVIYHYHLIVFPYSAMLREGAMMSNTDALVKGLNPYDISLQPEHTNQYGIMYPLIVWPWAKMFGTTILVHRIVTAFFLVICCAFVFLILKKLKTPLLVNIWAVLMLYASLLYPGTSTPCIDPATTGLFFLLSTIFIPCLCRYSYTSLLISILCGVLAFYTKPYTMLGIAIIATYLFLFISKKKALLYTSIWFLLMIISITLMNAFSSAYFDNCFFSLVNVAKAWSTMERLHMQLVLYSNLHQPIFILTGIIILIYAINYLRSFSVISFQQTIRQGLLSLRWTNIQEPLIKIEFPLIVFAGLWASVVLLLFLGRHTGATLWYFFQLLSPFLLMCIAWLVSQQKLWPILCAPFLIYNLYVITLDTKSSYFKKNAEGWPELSMLINNTQHVLSTPLAVPLLIEQHKEFFDNGQTEYFLPGGNRSDLMKLFSKEDPKVLMQYYTFFQKMRTIIRNKGFQIIILQPSLLPLIDQDIRQYYKFEGQFLVYAPQDRKSYAVALYIPKPN